MTIQLGKTIEYLMCGGITLLALTEAVPARAVSFISTFRPPGDTTEVRAVDASTGSSTFHSSSILQLTDIALSTTNDLFGVTYDQLYKLNPGNNTHEIKGNLGVTGMTGLGFDNKNNLFGIAGRSRTPNEQGQLVGDLGFYSINTLNGIATSIPLSGSGAAEFSPTAFSFVNDANGKPVKDANGNKISLGDAGDIVFNPYTNEFLTASANFNDPNNSTLFSISSTGKVTKLGEIGGSGRVSGLTFEGGNLIGYTTDRQQFSINLATLGTSVRAVTGITMVDVNGVATLRLVGGAASTPTTPVPEPSSTSGFIVLGVCLGTRFLMKRKQQPVE
jgi:hypothetical protein